MGMMATGLFCRFLGVLVTTYGTLQIRNCSCPACLKANKASALHDTLFCFLSTLPRATIQGALGPVPLTFKFFRKDINRIHIEHFIANSARLYIVLMSVMGSILLDTLGPMALKSAQETHERLPRCQIAKGHEESLAEEGWTAQERKRNQARNETMAAMLDELKICDDEEEYEVDDNEAVRVLAESFAMDSQRIWDFLRQDSEKNRVKPTPSRPGDGHKGRSRDSGTKSMAASMTTAVEAVTRRRDRGLTTVHMFERSIKQNDIAAKMADPLQNTVNVIRMATMAASKTNSKPKDEASAASYELMVNVPDQLTI